MKTKRIMSFSLVLALMVSMLSFSSAVVSANYITVDEYIPIMPTWEHTTRATNSLTFSGRTATCTGDIVALPGATITATLTLYRHNGSSWVRVTSWTRSSSTAFLSFNETHTVSSSGTYRTVLRGTVTRNGTSESISVTSTERTVN